MSRPWKTAASFFERAARLLAVFQALPHRCDALLHCLEPRFGFGEALRMRGDFPPRVFDRIVELLKLDETFQIGSHC